MIVPRKYVHFLLIISFLLIMTADIIMLAKRKKVEWNKQIWIGAKILTLKNLIAQNNNNIFPILSISNDGKTNAIYNKTYEYLLKHSGEKCEENFKKCGILDTLGNIICIPKEDECPINDLIIDKNILMMNLVQSIT